MMLPRIRKYYLRKNKFTTISWIQEKDYETEIQRQGSSIPVT